MAHKITAPAMQRAQRLLDQRITPFIRTAPVNFAVTASEELFTSSDYATAVQQTFETFTLGTKWGRAWHTRWFTLAITVPATHADQQLVAYIDPGFIGGGDGFQLEALAYRNGKIVHAIQPDRRLIHLGQCSAGGNIEIVLEAAATPIIAGHEYGYGPTTFGDPATAPATPLYTFRSAQLAIFNEHVNDLAVALHSVINLTLDLDSSSPQRARAFAALEDCANNLDVEDVVGTATAARRSLDAVLLTGNGPGSHNIVATGHAHLDTAWLWPLRETRRKAVRTFANAVYLLKKNPDAVFCHSQAQHYAWVAQDAPELFAEVQQLVAQGRWEPIGGMWVETDLNLPSGESLLRQLNQGQRAFQEWFGVTCNGAFLPDDFGYPGGLPQIVAHGGCQWFFTQKLSWNETDRMPHHTFWWEGIDGSAVFTHFSPIDTYNAIMNPSQLRFAERNFKDHAGSSVSLALYGHGDGGGGPTQTMIDRSRLASNLEGVPRVSFGTVKKFFADAESEYGASAPRWVGEMYFEKHRGTYSTQVGTKQGNRCSERLLHELELWSALAKVRLTQIDDLWQRVLTQQFHDIIPGSSIAWVHHDAEAEHEAVAEEIEAILARVLPISTGATHILNPAPVARHEVIDVDGDPRWIDVESFGASAPQSTLPHTITPVSVQEHNNGWELLNGSTSIFISASGEILSLQRSGRNVLMADSLPCFTLRRDTPAEYDAWDIDMADANSPITTMFAATNTALVESGPLRAVVECTFASPLSRFIVRYTLRANSDMLDISLDADWHESEKRLQWQMPLNLRALDATCGTQFGHVQRARHGNTSWDIARFEVCAHRYVAVSEPRCGVALLSDGPHGYDIRGSDLALTLLRAPHFPDPEADLGQHHFEWSVLLTDGDPLLHGLEETAARQAFPVRICDGEPRSASTNIALNVEGALISAVKPADDGSGDTIIRVWETMGAHTTGTLFVTNAQVFTPCNALEEPIEKAIGMDGSTAEFALRPFEIFSVRVSAL